MRTNLVDRAAGSLACPVTPPEVWGAGVTYRRSADFREEGTGFYNRVYDAERPELFFKASPGRCARILVTGCFGPSRIRSPSPTPRSARAS